VNCPVLGLLAKCCCSCGTVCSYCTRLTIVVIAIVFGALISWKPKKTIDIQMALYRPFNWKLEPISMEKEIRNTRIMGLIVLILGILSFIHILLK
jgi:hypothetical protein